MYLHWQLFLPVSPLSIPCPPRPGPARRAGFSLVEVALAIAVIAFAFVALLALLPAGLTTFRRALDISICTEIAQRIVSDAQGADFDNVTDRAHLPAYKQGNDFSFRAPEIDHPGVRFYDEQGNEIVPAALSSGKGAAEWKDLNAGEQLRVVYHVNVRIVPRVTPPTGPAGSADGYPLPRAAGELGSLALMTVQIAHNPSGAVLKLSEAKPDDADSPDRNLWKPRDGVDVFTYSAYIARNQ